MLWGAVVALLGVCASGTEVIGYLPEWRYGSFNFETAAAVYTHLVFFSLEPGPDGQLWGMDRFPSNLVLLDAKAAQKRHGGLKLLVCFGGNGRSTHFGSVTASAAKRATFVENVKELIEKRKLDGVDLNWEFPGFQFGKGYAADYEREWGQLAQLMRDLREALPGKVLTMAYYPDGRQEQLLARLGVADSVNLMHAMSYDASGPQHSTFELAQKTIDNAAAAGLPMSKVSVGVPFYGRKGNEWITYEDIVQRYKPLPAHVDSVDGIGFNGRDMIARKVRLAARHGANVMVWEAGQDCRVAPVTRNDQTHGVTCPVGASDSLLRAVADALAAPKDDL